MHQHRRRCVCVCGALLLFSMNDDALSCWVRAHLLRISHCMWRERKRELKLVDRFSFSLSLSHCLILCKLSTLISFMFCLFSLFHRWIQFLAFVYRLFTLFSIYVRFVWTVHMLFGGFVCCYICQMKSTTSVRLWRYEVAWIS